MMKQNRTIAILLLASAILLSLPFLVPHMGLVALVALVPLLCAERIAAQTGKKHFFWWYYLCFVVFNLLTTWWVCKATVGGGIFASLANALQMAVIFAVFRLSRKRFSGILPYIFLMVLWIAWEHWYLVQAQISWPWIVFGNAFARSVSLIQWYEITGALGGSLWIWASNIAIFSMMVALSDGRWWNWNKKAHAAAISALVLLLVGPMLASEIRYATYEEADGCGQLDVVMAQSNFDPWHKLRVVPQSEQNAQVVGLFAEALAERKSSENYPDSVVLMMLPETFTSDVWLNNVWGSKTFRTFSALTHEYPNTNLLFGASAHKMFYQNAKPNERAYKTDGGWYCSYNSALLMDGTDRIVTRNKTKLVVGVESTPFPKVFVPLDDAIGHVMGRCIPDPEARVFEVKEYAGPGSDSVSRSIPIGIPICYESIYGDFCRQFVNKGAQAITVITNDGWWGNTPGYRQHFSYSRLRAIELRRDIARCANTGISGIINQRGDVLEQSEWWTPYVLSAKVNLSEEKTFFAIYGDITGRVCTFVAILLLLLLLVRFIVKR